MTGTLYHVPKTISSPIVQCLIELDVVGKFVAVQETTFPDLKSEAFLSINPMGTSPTFKEGEIILWESGAVLDYLLERYDQEHRLHPESLTHAPQETAATRAKYLQLKQYIIATVYPFVASLFVHTLKPIEEQDDAYVSSAKNKWTTLLGPVLTKWLGDGPFFLGSKVSAVDFLVAKPLSNANGLELLSEFPELKAHFERIWSRPSFAMAYESTVSTPERPKNDDRDERTLVLVPLLTQQ
jgi:glutathione S-transferase